MLELRLESLGPDLAIVELPYRPEIATAGDLVHGGAISTLADTAAALAAWSGHDPANGVKGGTVGMSLSFLAAGRGTALRARASISRRGRSICYCHVAIADADATPVAEALVTYRLGYRTEVS